MARKGKKGRNITNRGRGAASGGRGRGRGQGASNQGRGPGIIQQGGKEKKGGRGAGVAQRRHEAKLRRKGVGTSQLGAPLGRAVEEVRIDGFVRHSETVRAHSDAVMVITMTPEFVYTASRDKSLKRWKVGKSAIGRFELNLDVNVPLGDLCWSMVMVGEWIFCGLGDGTIKGFSKSGQEAVLKIHSKRVASLLVHEHVLISGGSDGSVRLWQADPSGSFACTNTITEGLSSAITCMAVLQGHLWVGGTSGVSVIELASLRVVHQIQPKKFVSGFLEFQGHLIVAYADGQLCIFDPAGVKKHDQPPLEAGPIIALAGLESGPRLLCGHAKGQMSSLVLPDFQLKTSWQCIDKCKVQSVCCTGQDGIFLMGSENGNIQVWQRSDTFVQV